MLLSKTVAALVSPKRKSERKQNELEEMRECLLPDVCRMRQKEEEKSKQMMMELEMKVEREEMKR